LWLIGLLARVYSHVCGAGLRAKLATCSTLCRSPTCPRKFSKLKTHNYPSAGTPKSLVHIAPKLVLEMKRTIKSVQVVVVSGTA
jgi:hypothetical protein